MVIALQIIVVVSAIAAALAAGAACLLPADKAVIGFWVFAACCAVCTGAAIGYSYAKKSAPAVEQK